VRLLLDDGTVLRFTDEDDIGDLYTFCPPEGAGPAEPTAVTAIGNGLAFVEFRGSSLKLELTRRDGDPFVRVDGTVYNGRPDHRLRVRLELGESPGGSTAMAPFELVDRPLVGEGYHEEAGSPTWPARGAVLAGGSAVLAEGVFEYEVVDDRLAVTLLRAVGIISRASLATRPVWAGPPVLAPDAQCLGETGFAFGIARNVERASLVELWERFALPILEVAAPGGGALEAARLLEVENANLSAARRVDGVVEVRLWNDRGAPRLARIAGCEVELGPARIVRIGLDPGGLPAAAPGG
jgi:hypothetical protein